MSHSIRNCTAEHETALALLVKLPGGRKQWFPKKAIHEDSEVYDGDEHREGTLVVKDWFAEQERLDD